MISKSLSFLGYTFGREAKTNLAKLLVKYGGDMPAKNLRMLSNYIANKAIVEGDVDVRRDFASPFRREGISRWRTVGCSRSEAGGKGSRR